MRVEKMSDAWCVEVWESNVGLKHMRLANDCTRKELFLCRFSQMPVQDHVEIAMKALAVFGIEFEEQEGTRNKLGAWFGLSPVSPEQAKMLLKMHAWRECIGLGGISSDDDDDYDDSPRMWEQTLAALPCGDA